MKIKTLKECKTIEEAWIAGRISGFLEGKQETWQDAITEVQEHYRYYDKEEVFGPPDQKIGAMLACTDIINTLEERLKLEVEKE